MQVFRYCLNLNFRSQYHVYDNIFALLHDDVQIMDSKAGHAPRKKIFVTSFNQFKKASSMHLLLKCYFSFMPVCMYL
jgi:hypothetical protein